MTRVVISSVVDAAVAGGGTLLQEVAQLGGWNVAGSRRVVVSALGQTSRFAFIHPLAMDWRDIETTYPGKAVQFVHVNVDGTLVEAVPSDVLAGDRLAVQFFDGPNALVT